MKIYVNNNCRKVKKSHMLYIYCGFCKYFIAKYQKVGSSNLVKMYNDRIVEGTIDFNEYHGALFCPSCGSRIATRYSKGRSEIYRLTPSAFNKSKKYEIDEK